MKWAILLLISIFISVCCGQMLEWDSTGNLIAHSYSVWGDWSAHFTFISNLLERGLAWISGDNPVFFGMPFRYPFLSHLLTAVVSFVTRMDVVHATFWTSIVFLFALPFVLTYFFESLQMTPRQAVLATALFLFIGGLQAFDSSLTINDPLTNQFQEGSVFTQIVLFELFPQRAFLFGMILLVCGLGRWLRHGASIPLALYFSLLAWMHLHSWIAMGTVLFFHFVFRRKGLIFGILVLGISAPLISFLLLRGSSTGLSWDKWFPGWAQNPGANLPGAMKMNPVSFWIYNTGLFLPLAVAGASLLWKQKVKCLESPVVLLGAAGAFLFLIAEFINIQPYFYDNLKIFTYAFLFMAPLAAIALDALFVKKYLIAVALALLALQIYTAVKDYTFFYDHRQATSFFSKDEFDLASEFRKLRRSPDALVVISPKHNHWVPALAGSPVLMGYPGWLWSWGISYHSREAEVNEILLGGARTQDLLSRYPVEYIVVNDHDQVDKKPVAMEFFRSRFKPVLERGSWHVFSVK